MREKKERNSDDEKWMAGEVVPSCRRWRCRVTTNSGRWCDEWERKEKRKKKEEEREIKEKKGKKEEGDEGREVWRKEGRREGKNGPHYKWGQ